MKYRKVKHPDLRVEYTKGSGPGGQRKNKLETAVRLVHIPTGISVFQDGRSRQANERMALKALEKRLSEEKASADAEKAKAHRDYKIHNTKIIRTYNFKRQQVKDHRSGKTAPLQRVLNGELDLILGGK